ncbi:MAG TPA: TIGR03118 family protein [Candidatus Sulfotelmatobacter sp.]|nr:TIGR03118 family protein [Candidatus Sulfotelmatobacter sp.]
MQRRMIRLALAVGLALVFVSSAAMAQYQLTNLSSNQVKQARHDDPLLVNAWGLVHGSGTPWWVSDNGSGWSTLYDGNGNQNQSLKVLIPTAGENGPGSPTGIVFNGSSDFQLGGWPTFFLFAAVDGSIIGWAPQSNFNQAIVAPLVNAPKGASYTGLAISKNATKNHLYAADLANNTVDVYDGTFNMVMQLTASKVPAGFAPFGIQDINGLVYVTYASVAGGGGGYVVAFEEDGTPVNQGTPLISNGPLNQPWGITLAPKNFGPLSNTILISNNTNQGTINGFNLEGQFVGVLKYTTGKAIRIDQLWGIGFGDGTGKNGPANALYFAAGPHGNLAGTFGSIVFKP